MKQVSIYTDGACSGNPGPGGWAAILIYQGVEKELSGGEKQTTNNRMELRYVIDALEKGWAENWRKKGWMRNKKDPALNPDLWETLLNLVSEHEMHYHWVKGHADNPYNNRCDAMAVAERDRYAG